MESNKYPEVVVWVESSAYAVRKWFTDVWSYAWNKTEKKLDSYYSVKDGWRFGRGQAPSRAVIEAAKTLNRTALLFGLTRTDAFLGQNGSVTIAIYLESSDRSFQVRANGIINFGSETEADVCEEGLSLPEALNRVLELSPATWNSPSYCISNTSIQLSGVSAARRLRTQATDQESRLSTLIARAESQETFATMRAGITRAFHQSRLYFGSSTPEFCPIEVQVPQLGWCRMEAEETSATTT